MPSTVTHNYFAIDVLDGLNDNIKDKISKEINTYKVFSNGPDPLFSYMGKDKKLYRKLGHTMHREKTGLFFKNTINYIMKNNLQNNSQVLAYLYGNITHYVLDSTIHPLVYYETGRYIKGKKDRKIYKGKHSIMELTIDEFMIALKSKEKINKFKIHKFAIPKMEMSNELIDLINYSGKKTYNVINVANAMEKAIKETRLIYKYLRYDRFGIKRFIYNILDILTFKKTSIFKVASYKFNYEDYLFYLNFEKEEWYHPVDKTEIVNYSFLELYIIAYKNAIKLIDLVDKVLNNKIDIDDIFELLNKSYLTGKSMEDKRKIQYFSY